MKEKKVRITFDANMHLRAEIKMRAARRGISLKTWVERAIIEQIKREERYESRNDEQSGS